MGLDPVEQMAAPRRQGAAGRLLRQSRHRHFRPWCRTTFPMAIDVQLQSEKRHAFGMGPFPYEGEEDAGPHQLPASQTVSELPTTSYFSSAGLVRHGGARAGIIDLSILGANAGWRRNGDLANWMIPRQRWLKGHGRARMDLVAGVKGASSW